MKGPVFPKSEISLFLSLFISLLFSSFFSFISISISRSIGIPSLILFSLNIPNVGIIKFLFFNSFEPPCFFLLFFFNLFLLSFSSLFSFKDNIFLSKVNSLIIFISFSSSLLSFISSLLSSFKSFTSLLSFSFLSKLIS